MDPLLSIHVAGAAVGLVTGAAGLSVRKGSHGHRQIGKIFVYSMLVMALAAAPLAAVAGKWLDVLSALLTTYLVLSAWTTVRPATQWVQVGLLLLAISVALGYLAVEWVAISSGERRPDVPAGAGFVFAAVLTMAAFGDVRLFLGRQLDRRARLTRHLWRMCFALFMATASFFAARPHLFPQLMQDSGALILLALAPLLLLFFWWVRLRWANAPAG